MASKTVNLGLGLSIRAGTLQFGPLLNILRQELVSDTKRRFATETDPDGKPWAPLARPRSRKRDKSKRRRKGSVDKILQDTGVLRSSATSRAAAGNIDRISDFSLEWGTNLHYGAYHQSGTRNMPARPFIGISEESQERIEEIVADWVADQVYDEIGGG